jgi:hypothetical protein
LEETTAAGEAARQVVSEWQHDLKRDEDLEVAGALGLKIQAVQGYKQKMLMKWMDW